MEALQALLGLRKNSSTLSHVREQAKAKTDKLKETAEQDGHIKISLNQSFTTKKKDRPALIHFSHLLMYFFWCFIFDMLRPIDFNVVHFVCSMKRKLCGHFQYFAHLNQSC